MRLLVDSTKDNSMYFVVLEFFDREAFLFVVTACEDKSSDCEGYGTSICTGEYENWAKETCPKMCGICSGGSEPAAGL